MAGEQLLPEGWRLVEFSSIDSTNAEVLRLAEAGEQEGLAVRADQQSAGRGRRSRTWVSPAGNLYLSVLIDVPLKQAGQAGFAISLAVFDAIGEILGQRAPQLSCKWPNDLLLDGDKVAGLLLEAVPKRDQVVAGIGVNLVSTRVADAVYPIGSLAAFDLDARELACQLCLSLERWLRAWRTNGFTPLRISWLARAHGIGERIVVRLPRDTYEGVFKGLSEDGSLLLDQGARGVRTVAAGDVFFGAGV